MKTMAEIAKRLRELAWGISSIEEGLEMEAMAKQLEEFSVQVIVSINTDDADSVEVSATSKFDVDVIVADHRDPAVRYEPTWVHIKTKEEQLAQAIDLERQFDEMESKDNDNE